MLGVTSFEKGLEQGLEKGREEGYRSLLLRMIEKKFGKLSGESRKRFEAMPAAGLADLGEQLMAGAGLAELGLEADGSK
jgi:flagellar biosynthesis/type III secretory pathway protein FliH